MEINCIVQFGTKDPACKWNECFTDIEAAKRYIIAYNKKAKDKSDYKIHNAGLCEIINRDGHLEIHKIENNKWFYFAGQFGNWGIVPDDEL